MATTLAQLAENSTDKLKQGFINELITDSKILSLMPFDDCLTATGTSDLVYGYKRVISGATAAFRKIDVEPAVADVEIKKYTTKPGILSSAWQMDRVAKGAAEDIYELKVVESKNSIIRGFNKTLITGDTTVDADGFDGLSKALTGSSTEFTSLVNLSTIDKDKALAFANEMDILLSSLTRDPDVLAVSLSMATKINAVLRILGFETMDRDDAGKRVRQWDNIPIEVLKDGAHTSLDIYAMCFGMDEFHGLTLTGDAGISIALPDWSSPGAVKKGDSEFVCGCALKKTKAAGVLRALTVVG